AGPALRWRESRTLRQVGAVDPSRVRRPGRAASARRISPDEQRQTARADQAPQRSARRAAARWLSHGIASASRARPGCALRPAPAAHELTLRALELGADRFFGGSAARQPDPPVLAQRLWGLDFPNPVGLAAGYDKDARVPDAMLRLGFGFTEVGTVTPRPQPGNPKPRVFRLEEDQAIINRMGFNSHGLDAVGDRPAKRAP